jgi:L-rhamnose mutarotase
MTKRIGMLIGIKPEQIDAYKQLHAAANPGVRDLLEKAHIKNFSIFIRQLDDGKPYLFGYYEYSGDNYEEDTARFSAERRNQDWLRITDAMQVPLRGERSWSIMEEVYHND